MEVFIDVFFIHRGNRLPLPLTILLSFILKHSPLRIKEAKNISKLSIFHDSIDKFFAQLTEAGDSGQKSLHVTSHVVMDTDTDTENVTAPKLLMVVNHARVHQLMLYLNATHIRAQVCEFFVSNTG